MTMNMSFVIKQQQLNNKQTMQAHGQISMRESYGVCTTVIDLNHIYINFVLHVH